MWLGSRDPHTQSILEYTEDGPVSVSTTWVPALFTAFRELFDNALDEVVSHGNGDRIDVSYDETSKVFSIRDNGRGVPIEWDETEQKYAATVLLSEQNAGRNFEDDRGATRGLNGVGGAVVNFTSEYFLAHIIRGGQSFTQRFVEGLEHVAEDPVILPAKKSDVNGTRIEFKLSKKVFKDMRLPESFIRSRMFEAALCYPNLKIFYNGKQVKTRGVEKDLFPKRKPITVEIDEPGFRSRFWLVPQFFADGTETSHSLVNAIPMFNGGVHIDTFKRMFFSGLINALAKESKKRKLTPNRSDLADGMLIYNITEMDAPHFDSQSKTRVINEGVNKIVTAALDNPDFFKNVIRKNGEWIEDVYKRCAERTLKKESSEISKLAKKGGKVRVAKLKDATHSDRQQCSLYITEGDSAVGGLVDARDARIHAAMPLKGKVMNVHGMSPKQIYENEELARMMNAIGLVPGQRVNRHLLRYGRVYITCDADEDGKSITGLLTNFFYLNWPELFEADRPFIHVFDTPLIIAAKGKERKYWYADNEHTFKQEDFKGWEITRAKGLAQLKKPDWQFALNNPKSIPLTDDGDLNAALSLIFDPKKADARKEWIGI
jgi:DNA gyrase/topoisomerase IV subunit B